MAEKKVKEAKVVEDNTKTSGKSTDVNTGMAILAYFIFFIPLLTEYKDNTFVKYHVKQSILLLIAYIICTLIPVFGWIASFGVFVLWIMGVINAANGKQEPVPVIGKFAEEWFKF